MALPSFTFRPGINAEAMTIVWNNPHGLAIVEEGTAEVLLARRWGNEVPDNVLEAWNTFVAENAPDDEDAGDDDEPQLPLDAKIIASAPTPTAQTTVAPTAKPDPEPVAKAPDTEPPKAPEPKPAPEPAKATKPAATKEELLKRAEEEAAAKAKDK